MRTRLSEYLLALCMVASQCSAQGLSNPPGGSLLPPAAGVREWVNGVRIPTIKNAPFSARVEIETTKRLLDGSSVSRKTMNVIARDEIGRTHNEGRQLLSSSDSSEQIGRAHV